MSPIARLEQADVKPNVTAVITLEGLARHAQESVTLEQVRGICKALRSGPPASVSVFAGRIANTGRDPVPLVAVARADAHHGECPRAAGGPARDVEHLSGRRDPLRHHHGDE